MDNKTRKVTRKTWIQAYETLGSISKVARRCGIPRSTLYRWLKRYKLGGLAGLQDKTQRPNKLSKLKVTPDIEKLIIDLRKNYKFGPKCISIQLLRNNNIKLSESTIWRVLSKNNMPKIKKYRKRNDFIHYNRPIPGDRVQVDVTKVSNQCYQFTDVDDCKRLRVLGVSLDMGNYCTLRPILCRRAGLSFPPGYYIN